MFYVAVVAAVGFTASLWGIATAESHQLFWWSAMIGFLLVEAFALQFLIDT